MYGHEMMAMLDLGSLELEDNKSGTSVRLRSCANFAPSEKDDIDRLQALLTSEKLTQDRVGLPWIRAREHVSLILTLRFEHGESTSTIEEVVENMSAHLSDAKAWERLGLEILSIQQSASCPDGTIELRVKHSLLDPRTANNRTQHKLGNYGPISDVSPPTSVGHMTAESFNLLAAISGLRNPPPTAESAATDPPRTTGLCESINLFASGDFEEYMLDGNDFSTDADPGISQIDHDSSEDTQIFQLQHEDHNVVADKTWKSGPICRTELTEPSSETPQVDRRHSMSCTPKLIISAVEAAILGASRRRMKGIKVRHADHRPLATVVPSVWLPGYLQSIAENSVFLPTIAHALANVLGGSVTQASSTSETQENYANRKSGCDTDQTRNPPPSSSTVSDPVHASLWQNMDIAVYRARTAKSTRLIWAPSDGISRSQPWPDDMLEPSKEHHFGAEPHGEDDDAYSGHYRLGGDDRSENSLSEMIEFEGNQNFMSDLARTHEAVSTQWSDVLDAEELLETMDTPETRADSSRRAILDEDMLSVCSSTDILSLPDVDACPGDDIQEILCI